MLNDAAEPLLMTPSDMKQMIHADVARWTEVARVAGIRLPGARAAAR